MKEPRGDIRDRLRRIHRTMSGKLTRLEQLPHPDRIQSRLLPIADLFMVLMYSRPPGGSLRTARVTLVTIWLALALFVAAGIPGLFLTIHAIAPFRPLLLVVGLLAFALGLGSGFLATFGIRQRHTIRTAGGTRALPTKLGR